MTKRLFKWVGSDGRKYATDDPEVMRRRLAKRSAAPTGHHPSDDYASGEWAAMVADDCTRN